MFLRLENEPQYLILVLIEICSYDRELKKLSIINVGPQNWNFNWLKN